MFTRKAAAVTTSPNVATTTEESKEVAVTVMNANDLKTKVFTASEEEEMKYRELLRTKNGLIILPMASYGNFFFRSVSNSFYGTPDHHAIVRTKCMEYMVPLQHDHDPVMCIE
jgi:hypothetical protein